SGSVSTWFFCLLGCTGSCGGIDFLSSGCFIGSLYIGSGLLIRYNGKILYFLIFYRILVIMMNNRNKKINIRILKNESNKNNNKNTIILNNDMNKIENNKNINS